jgi:2-dehydro-3-deoxygalactonokinase
MIGIDWGTSSFRAYRLGEDDAVRDSRAAARGIMAVEGGRFEEELLRQVGDWIADGETRVLMSGMIGSRQGWVEAPYAPCPAGIADLAGHVVPVPCAGADVRIVPGINCADEAGVPEVMRGEETQLIGALPASAAAGAAGTALACLPGSHSKWAQLRDGRIATFQTFMTGEVFAALRGHTILGRMMQEGPVDPDAFAQGVARAADPGDLLHHLFGVRTLGLFGSLPGTGAAGYLSGLLIGHEVAAAVRGGGAGAGAVHLIGAAALCDLYASALRTHGIQAERHGEDAAARGLAKLGRQVQW